MVDKLLATRIMNNHMELTSLPNSTTIPPELLFFDGRPTLRFTSGASPINCCLRGRPLGCFGPIMVSFTLLSRGRPCFRGIVAFGLDRTFGRIGVEGGMKVTG